MGDMLYDSFIGLDLDKRRDARMRGFYDSNLGIFYDFSGAYRSFLTV